MTPRLLRTHLGWTLAGLGFLLAWDASGLDLALARRVADSHGFALRDHWLLSGLLHAGARRLGWLLALWLILGLWWPTGVLRRLARPERLQWAAGTLLALLLVSSLKFFSRTSCPWDLAEFGGVATYLSHWTWPLYDGGPGRCFPAGHASTGFAFVAGYFALRERSPRQAGYWLAGALAAGLVLGLAQQLRGAHFMSHTLWTAWLCWSLAFGLDALFRIFRPSGAPANPETPALPPAPAPTS